MSTKPQIELFLENENGTQQVAYPFVESDHVSLTNGMDIDTMIRQDVSMPTVTHEDLSFKVGVGDQDVSSAIVDSSVAEMTIKGKTYQNILPEPSTHVLSNNKEMFKVNEGLDPNVEIVDGVSKSAILSGNTLVNMCDDGVADASDIRRFTHNYTSNGGTFEQVSDGIKATTTQDNTWLIVGYDIRSQQKKMMTIGKKYYGVADVTIHKLSNSDSCKVIFRAMYGLRESKSLTDGRGLVQSVFTHGSVDANLGWLAVGTNGQKAVVGDSFTVHSMSVYEITDEEANLSYEELANKYPVKCVGMTSCKMPVLTTTGKNLFDFKNAQWLKGGNFNPTYGNSGNIVIENMSLKLSNPSSCVGTIVNGLKPNTEYYVTAKVTNTSPMFINSGLSYGVNNTTINGGINKKLTTNSKGELAISIGVYRENTNGGYVLVENIQVEEGSVATSYEPYKTNILSTPEDLELRGIGDVQDTLDCLTGEVTERIGEITFSGENGYWNFNTPQAEHSKPSVRFTFSKPILRGASTPNRAVQSDKIPTLSWNSSTDNEIYGIAGLSGELLYMYIPRSYIGLDINDNDTTSANSKIKEYFDKMGDVTVQYQLATESIKTVDLSSSGNWEKVILDGSENWGVYQRNNSVNFTNTSSFQAEIPNANFSTDSLALFTNSHFKPYSFYSSDREGAFIKVNKIRLAINKNKLVTDNVEGFKQYMRQNPVTVWYQTDASLDSTQVKQPIFFKDGHVQLSSGTDNSLIPTLDYQAKTSNSYVMDLMKNGVWYTMKAKSASGTLGFASSTQPLSTNGKFAVDGASFQNANKLMVINGSVEDLMILEGDLTSKTIPYFKGIKSAFEDESKIEVLSTSQNILNTSKIVQGDLLNSGVTAATGGSADLYCYTEDFIPCPNIKHPLYVHRTIDGVYSSSTYYIFFFDEDKILLQPRTVSNTFTIPDGAKYLRIMVHKGNVDVSRVGIMVTNSGADRFNQSVGGLQNSTKIPLLSPLRSLPNGVCDELIIDRMKKKATLIQRVGYGMLGRQRHGYNQANSSVNTNLYQPWYTKDLGNNVANVPSNKITMWCDKLLVENTPYHSKTTNSIHQYQDGSANFVGCLLKSNLGTKTVQQWFEANEVSVYYQLATPVITEVDLEGFPYIYKDGHIFLNGEVTPVTEIKYSINQQHQIEASNQDIMRHQKEIDYLYQLIGEYVRVDYKNTLLSLNLELK